MVLRYRYESAPGTFPVGRLTTYANIGHTGPPTSIQNYTFANPGIRADLVYSEGHKGPPYRSGGAFLTSRYGIRINPSNTFESNYLAQNYQGSVYNDIGIGSGNAPADISSELLLNGTKAWGRFSPTHNQANIGQFLAELRDLPSVNLSPSAARDAAHNFKRAGSSYLNLEFGWKPFISDIMDLLRFMQHAEERIDQLRRDNKRTVRRSGTVSSSSSTSSSVKTGLTVNIRPSIATQHFSNSAKWESTLITTTSSKFWFSAAYRYYIPGLNTKVGVARAIISQLGLSPSPSLLWEVMPWSWMIDWFGSFGDVLSNLYQQHEYNLTAKYAYIMGHKATYYNSSSLVFARDGTPLKFSSLGVSEVKARMAATPYGFAVDYGGLNPYQLSILGALGISRW